MSWSLLLQNGDLAISGNQLAQATGSQKLYQDLKCLILEPMGTDDLHPEYGSKIDGGSYQGIQFPSMIGRMDDFAALQIRSDLQRIIQYYQKQQLSRAQADSRTYGKTTLTLGEIIASVNIPQMAQYIDILSVQINITTAASSSFSVGASFS